MTDAGWGRPVNALHSDPTHFWKEDGESMCGRSGYIGPKLENEKLGEEMRALRLCPECIIAVGRAMEALGALGTKMIEWSEDREREHDVGEFMRAREAARNNVLRVHGQSSDNLARIGCGESDNGARPMDWDDLDACRRTWQLMPESMRRETAETLRGWQNEVRERYPRPPIGSVRFIHGDVVWIDGVEDDRISWRVMGKDACGSSPNPPFQARLPMFDDLMALVPIGSWWQADGKHFQVLEPNSAMGAGHVRYLIHETRNTRALSVKDFLRQCVPAEDPTRREWGSRNKMLADVFREAWEAADAAGHSGERTNHGIEAVLDRVGLDMETFQEVNAARARRWHEEGEPWTLADWGNAMGGECGEAQNVIKKIRRIDTGTGGNAEGVTREGLIEELGFELADTIAYAFLVAENAGLNLAHYVKEKFNQVSEKHGFEERL